MLCVLKRICAMAVIICCVPAVLTYATGEEPKQAIKWMNFDVCYSAMDKALKYDIESHQGDSGVKICWIDLLAFLGAKYGGDFKTKYREKDLISLVDKLKSGAVLEELASGMKYFNYYKEIYTAVLGEYVGEYEIQTEDSDSGNLSWEKKYGLKVFSPIARGFYYSDYDDFGTGRSYGYKRRHLGHDMMADTGTPIIAVEGGIVEAAGWNKYGGWRVGIRSFDTKRYYYYAHMRKDRPFHCNLHEGETVNAGDVIGYVGRSGYSTTENTNNIKQSHLHFGIQIIFDESQKECMNEIWIDCYQISKLLKKNTSEVYRCAETREFYRKFNCR